MALELRVKQKLQLNLRLEQRLEQKLKLQLQLAQTLPEFSEIIRFEDDDNLPLLEQSFPFMMYDEVSHPLHSKGIVRIPSPPPLPAEYQLICGKQVGHTYLHHATEVGIDRSAYLAGERNGRYTAEALVESHTAFVERVVRDTFETKRISVEHPFVARLQAELEVHAERANPSAEVVAVLGELRGRLQLTPKDEEAYRFMVGTYREIYQGTTLRE